MTETLGWAFLAAAFLYAFGLWRSYRGRRVGPPTHPEATTEVIPTGSIGPGVRYGAAMDARGRVHVAYRAMHGETRHIRRETDGTWTPPADLGGRGRVLVHAEGERVSVLVLAQGALIHVSNDGGVTWERPRATAPGLVAWDGDWVHLGSGRIVVLMAARESSVRELACVGHGWHHPEPFPMTTVSGTPLALWMLRSPDGGASWAPPVRIEGDIQTLRPEKNRPSLVHGKSVRLSAVPNGGSTRLYAAVSKISGRQDGLPGGDYLSRSEDGGATWTPLAPIDLRAPSRRIHRMEAAEMAPHARGPALLYNTASGGSLGFRRDPSDGWEETHLWQARGGAWVNGPARLFGTADGGVAAVWNDARRARREWWTGTPWSIVHELTDDGQWTHSDLLLARYSASGEASPPVPITPRGYLVWDAAGLSLRGNEVVAVWQGRQPGGRRTNEPMSLYLTRAPVA